MQWPLHPSSGVGAPSAGVGEAASLGSLSVPAAWTATAPQVEPALPSTALSVEATAPGRTFQEALMATVTGLALDQLRALSTSSATPNASAMIDTCGLTSGQLGRIEASATHTPSTPRSRPVSSTGQS